MPLKYAFEKFNAAIRALICLDIPLSDRLDAAIVEVSLLTPNKDLPPDFRKEFNQIMDKIHAYRSQNHRADMQAEIAWEIFDIYKKLVAFTGSSQGSFFF